jgi:hypothetical protein
MVHKDAGIPLSITLPIMTLTLTVLQYLLWRVTASYARTKAFKIFYAGLLIVCNKHSRQPGDLTH